MTSDNLTDALKIGVGLRHQHFEEALQASADIDFVEVHSENFFSKGGALPQLLKDIAAKYPVSLHSTAMGLGSETSIPESYLSQLQHLASGINPFLLSDHAAFSWGEVDGLPVHAGDLLPIAYNEASLQIMARHVEQIQGRLNRQILIENLSAYLSLPGSTMTEQAFLVELCARTKCGILLDLNNLLVNAHNQQQKNPLLAAFNYIDEIPSHLVGEIHLAGFSTPKQGEFAVDDHSQPVSAQCWALYQQALKRFGAVPTLIEWDNQLPKWQTLLAQASKARQMAAEVFSRDA